MLKRAKQRTRAPRIKRLPESTQDPRHDPEAALVKMAQVIAGGGRPLTDDEARRWLARIDLHNIPVENVRQDREGRLRYREANVRHGPGRQKLRIEQAVEKMEADWARQVNALNQVFSLNDHHDAAVRCAVAARRRSAADVADRVYALYETSSLPVRNRASAIARSMERDGHRLSVQQIRAILRRLPSRTTKA